MSELQDFRADKDAFFREDPRSPLTDEQRATFEGLDYYPWQDGLFTPPLEVTDGQVTPPEGPGWGVEIAPEWLARAQYRTT